MEKPILASLSGVSQIYGSAERSFTAIEDVAMDVREGELVALLGPSGCGKSTLLRIITGLQKPSRGQVMYRGLPLRGVNPHATIVFQTFALFPWLRVQENVEMPLKAKGRPADQRRQLALEAIDRVGLDGFESAYPRELSGGMRQKVGFARALVTEPELLCLDEPFSALDVLSAEALRGELLELWLEGNLPTKAILLVSHNIEEVVALADRVLVMEKNPGRIVAEMRIDLLHPRQRKSTAFQVEVDRLYALLAGHTQPEWMELGTAPGQTGHTPALPEISISDLAGLLEHLNAAPGDREDIYRLAEDLGLDSDHLLRLVQATELLSLATISEGDIALTSLGETFADAGIQARKEIFASRLRRLPVFQWLLALLGAAEGQKLQAKVVQTALELEFSAPEAAKQIGIIVKWGRYAELLAYDDNDERLYLELEQPAPSE